MPAAAQHKRMRAPTPAFAAFFRYIALGFSALMIAVGALADYVSVGDGSGLGVQQLLLMGTGMVLLTVSIRMPRAAALLGMNALILIPILLMVDRLLFQFAPAMPVQLVSAMSLEAQARYGRWKTANNQNEVVFGADGNYWGNPLTPTVDGFYDEHGYRNPVGYLAKNPAVDILLIGDSFTEGQESQITIANVMRDLLPALRIYSAGMHGQSTNHWALQYKRFVEAVAGGTPPRMVIANYYAANDAGSCNFGPESLPAETHRFDPDAPAVSSAPGSELKHIAQRGLRNAATLAASAAAKWQNPLYAKTFGRLGLFVLEGLRVDTPNLLHKQREQPAEVTASACALQTIRDFAAAVRATHANTQIAIAYIAPDRVIWAPRADDATDHDREVHAQQANAATLSKLSQELKIRFVDPTAELRADAQTERLYHQGLHVNSYGYSLYAAYLVQAMAPDLILQ